MLYFYLIERLTLLKGKKLKFIPITFLFISIISFYNKIHAATSSAGTTTAEFLTINPDARASAMGMASAALIDDADSLLWNPAVLGYSNSREVSISSMKMNSFEDGFFSGAKLTAISALYALPQNTKAIPVFPSIGTLGFALVYADYGEIPITTSSPDSTGSFVPRNLSVNMYWGNRFYKYEYIKNIPFGVGIKYIYQSIDQYSSHGFATDIGAGYIFPSESKLAGFRYTFSILNLGYVGPFIEENDPLPLTFKNGIAYDFKMNSIIHALGGPKTFFPVAGPDSTIALDATKIIGHNFMLSSGLELAFYRRFVLRTGYMLFQDTKGFTGGLGINYETSYGIYKIDFAWIPQNYLGDNFRLTINYKWGERLKSNRIKSRVLSDVDENNLNNSKDKNPKKKTKETDQESE